MKKRFWITALSACVLLTGCSMDDLAFWQSEGFQNAMNTVQFWKKTEEEKKDDQKEA